MCCPIPLQIAQDICRVARPADGAARPKRCAALRAMLSMLPMCFKTALSKTLCTARLRRRLHHRLSTPQSAVCGDGCSPLTSGEGDEDHPRHALRRGLVRERQGGPRHVSLEAPVGAGRCRPGQHLTSADATSQDRCRNTNMRAKLLVHGRPVRAGALSGADPAAELNVRDALHAWGSVPIHPVAVAADGLGS